MIDGTLPGYWALKQAAFTVTNGTRAKVLVDITPAAVVAAVAGETALPNGESAVRQRVLQGGCRVLDGMVSSTDAAAKSLQIWNATQLTKQADMGTANFATTSTFTRSAGSFLADGWLVGDAAMAFGATTDANNGVALVITGVVAGTLTVNGTPLTIEAMAAGSRICRVTRHTQKAVPANSGNSDTLPAVPLLGGTQDPTIDTSGRSLGANDMIVVGLVAAASAVPAQIMVTANIGLY